MVTPTFRAASVDDVEMLVGLINRAFVVERVFKAGGDRIDRAAVATLLEKGSLLIAEEDDGPRGCVYCEPRGGSGYLGLLAVEPEFQGKGLGSKLMQAGEERLREAGCSVAEIQVLSLRTELPPIYRRAGYVDAGTEPVRVESITVPCEFLKMTKALS